MNKMEIKVDKKDNRATLVITDEDLAIGYILRKELLENNEVVFAGAVKPHPLVNNFKVQIETKKKDTMAQVITSSDKAVQTINEIFEKFSKSLSK
jgi:DNA-directed RNA polymerase subunit L|tara:strand:- start:98 stop:382 length:285 start_codon:yes stop_codon:yes gene_type:complete